MLSTFGEQQHANELDTVVPPQVFVCSSTSGISDVDDSDDAATEAQAQPLERSERSRPAPPRAYSPGLFSPPKKRQRLDCAPSQSLDLPDAVFMLSLLKAPLINRRVAIDIDASVPIELPATLGELVDSGASITRALQRRPRSGASLPRAY